MLEKLGKPYVVENVMGARYGSKGLTKRGLEAHGLEAGWLCGGMFGKPYYRHRLFATNWLWLAPEHPKHQAVIRSGHSLAGRARDIVFAGIFDAPSPHGQWEERPRGGWPEDLAASPTKSRIRGGRLPVSFQGPWQNRNGAQTKECGVGHPVGWRLGHAPGWRLAAEAMEIDWMNQAELTQAIPPVYTEHIGQMLLLRLRQEDEHQLTSPLP